MKQFAISKGINLKKFSTNGTEQLRRVRRSKKKIGYRLSIPSMRSAKEKKKIDVQSFVERPQLYIFGLSGKIKTKHELITF